MISDKYKQIEAKLKHTFNLLLEQLNQKQARLLDEYLDLKHQLNIELLRTLDD